MPDPVDNSNDTATLRRDALGWFVRRQDAGWTGRDERSFQHWIDADPAHRENYERCTAQWQALDGMPTDLIARMRRRLEQESSLARPQTEPARRRFLKPAFALTTAFAMGGAGYLAWEQMEGQPISVQSFTTERGQQKDIVLPDGSRLRLDTSTRIEVAYFRTRREVRLLEGQAVFAVRSEPARPFDVLAGPLRVTVVGTRFSVRHTPGQPGRDGVSVAVEEGKVKVSTAAGAAADRALYLVAGQTLSNDLSGVFEPIGPLPSEGFAQWREQRISFVDARLDHVLVELRRYGRTGLVVNDASVAALRLSGTFDPINPAALRLALSRALPVRLVDDGNEVEVLPAN